MSDVRGSSDGTAGEVSDSIPWAMQIALRVEKVDPPHDIDACEAAARACVSFIAEAEQRGGQAYTADGSQHLASDVIASDGAPSTDAWPQESNWYAALQAWRGIAIRKIVRRARGKRWSDAQALPGVTVEQGRAAARAFVPAPLRPLPPELAKMQVEGTDLEPGTSTNTQALVTIRINPHLVMTTGKTAAQCAHAAQRAWETMSEREREIWGADQFRMQVQHDAPATWQHQPGRVSIIDAGFTELEGQHETTRADWDAGLGEFSG